jgi:putative transposase
MKRTDYKPQYRRNLPHYQPHGATLFVNIRLTDTLPLYIIERLQSDLETRKTNILKNSNENDQKILLNNEDKRYFAKMDRFLDKAQFGPTWLANPEAAAKVYESLCFRNGRVYELDSFTIMPNHVHIVFRPFEDQEDNPVSLASIMMSLKRYTARQCNDILGREGQFWQHESYDHVIRNQAEWERIIKYVLDNPVKAGLVEKWDDWPWTYLREM